MEIREVSFSGLLSAVIDNRGKTCPTADSGIPLIATNCIRNDLLYPTYEKARFVSPQTYATWFRGHPRPGDILFVNKATPGRVCLVPDPVDFCIAQDMVAVRADPNKIYPRYLFAVLRSPIVQERIARMHVGTLIPHFKKTDFDKLLLPVPGRDEQRFIGDIYFELSAKIDLNRRMSETLEAMARALFQSWFVDFEPVRENAKRKDAKTQGRRENTAASAPLRPGDFAFPPHILDLFPDRLVDSELGEIPEGWEVTELSELVDTVKGRSYKSDELVESDTALVTLKSFARGGGYRRDGLKSFAGRYKAEQVLSPGEVVIACTDVTQAAEVIGRPAIVRGTAGYRRLVASLDTLIVRPRDSRMSRALLYFLAGTEAFTTHTYAHTSGTTVLHLAKEAVPSFKFARPSTQLVGRFDALAAPALDKIQALDEESATVAALRDTLLPKLISGELRVKDAEKFIGKVI